MSHAGLLERAGRVQHSLATQGGGSTASAAVDGDCPSGDCGEAIVVEVRADTSEVTCPKCGSHFAVPAT